MKHSMDGMDTMDTGGIVRISHLNEFWSYEKDSNDYANMTKYDVLDKMVRQGDVVLYPIDELPKYAQLQYNRILAFGEKSGHRHTMKGQVEVYETLQPEPIRLLSMAKVQVKKFVKVLETSMLQPATLVHEDKKEIGRAHV